eukprot:TRINITY_DN63965_c0_g1_i1.p1 TRINITY_DN63965_c0_g1~~TRINITY_DN63965_c0_g1_i1.p1  ORF type:complete len:244 (+),score=38.36 TRINITY_DN63965_c0_g1_i1:89-733(+)
MAEVSQKGGEGGAAKGGRQRTRGGRGGYAQNGAWGGAAAAGFAAPPWWNYAWAGNPAGMGAVVGQKSTKGKGGQLKASAKGGTSPLAVPQLEQIPSMLSLSPQGILGDWADSLGNQVKVFSTDAYSVRLQASLTRPPRPDIILQVMQVPFGGGWQCGNSVLDPFWSTEKELHWVASNGKISVWVRSEDKQTPVGGSVKEADNEAKKEPAGTADS